MLFDLRHDGISRIVVIGKELFFQSNCPYLFPCSFIKLQEYSVSSIKWVDLHETVALRYSYTSW